MSQVWILVEGPRDIDAGFTFVRLCGFSRDRKGIADIVRGGVSRVFVQVVGGIWMPVLLYPMSVRRGKSHEVHRGIFRVLGCGKCAHDEGVAERREGVERIFFYIYS